MTRSFRSLEDRVRYRFRRQPWEPVSREELEREAMAMTSQPIRGDCYSDEATMYLRYHSAEETLQWAEERLQRAQQIDSSEAVRRWEEIIQILLVDEDDPMGGPWAYNDSPDLREELQRKHNSRHRHELARREQR